MRMTAEEARALLSKSTNLAPRKRRNRHLEDDLQASFVEWFNLKLPQYLLYAIPNGGKRFLREAVRLKRQGVLAGVPDLFLAEQRKGFGGLYLELKVGRNGLSQEQVRIHAYLRVRGYKVDVCRSFEECVKSVCEYLGVRP